MNCPLFEAGTPPPHNSDMAYCLETGLTTTTKQASPPDLKLYFYIVIFMFSLPPSTSCKRKQEQGGLDKNDWELYGGGRVHNTVGNFGILVYLIL